MLSIFFLEQKKQEPHSVTLLVKGFWMSAVKSRSKVYYKRFVHILFKIFWKIQIVQVNLGQPLSTLIYLGLPWSFLVCLGLPCEFNVHYCLFNVFSIYIQSLFNVHSISIQWVSNKHSMFTCWLSYPNSRDAIASKTRTTVVVSNGRYTF